MLQSAPKVLAPVKDVTRAIKLDFELRYVKCGLAPKAIESHPMLQLFLGAQFERDRDTGGIVNIRLNEDDLTLRYTGSLIGTLKREHREIPAATAIGLDSYAIHRNDSGHSCYVNVGTSFALLQDVLREIKIKGAYEREHHLTMHTVVVTGTEPIDKGVVSLRITQCAVGSGLNSAVSAFIRAPPPTLLMQSNPAQACATINAYIDATVALEQALPDTVPNTERMRAFMDISESGAQMLPGGSGGAVFLPIAAYALVETPRANEGFFQNAYERVMARRGLTLGAWHDFDVKEKARTMALMLSHGVQTFDYIGDAVEMSNRMERITQRRHVGNEEFSDIWNSLVGDCEDGARGIMSVYKAFIATPLTHPDLCEMQQYARQYVPLSTLSVVHGAKIGDQEGFGAHMYLPLFPRSDFEAGLARTPEGKRLLERLAPAAPLVGAAASADDWRHQLPRMFCEGTGRIDPLGYHDPIFEQRKYVAMQLPSLGGYKKEIPREEGAPSTFYHANLLGITDQFVEQNGVPVAGFIFCQDNGAGKPLTRGSLFTDFVRGTANLAIIPQPPVPPDVMAMIGEATALRPPARPLELDARKPLSGPKSNRHLDALCKGINELGHPAPSVKPAAAVQVVMRPHQISESAVQQILHEARQSERLYAATYECEQVTQEIHHYLVSLWVK